MQSRFNLVPYQSLTAQAVICPDCKGPVDILRPADWEYDTTLPAFYICWPCNKTFQSGVGPVQKVKKEEETLMAQITIRCGACKQPTDGITTPGGIRMTSGKYICPRCTPEVLKSLNAHDQLWAVADYCPSEMSFSAWVDEKEKAGAA